MPSNWQDIATAPFDYDKTTDTKWLEWVLLWLPDQYGGFPIVGCMDADMWLYRTDDRACGDIEIQPTHWMPLPDPPTEQTEAG